LSTLFLTFSEYTEHEKEEIPGAQINYSQSRGYHFTLHTKDPYNVRLPSYCIQIVQNKLSITFTTRDLIKFNGLIFLIRYTFLDRLIQSESELLQTSNLVLDQMIANIRDYLSSLYQCAELISLLDCYTSIACYSSKTRTGNFSKHLIKIIFIF
jgi:DNA mismatch repair ATPase MutS